MLTNDFTEALVEIALLFLMAIVLIAIGLVALHLLDVVYPAYLPRTLPGMAA